MQPKVDTFIALVADMRDSSNHLLQAISDKKAKVSQLQRVFYETSALLPALAKTVADHNGKVTEYLGDGILALFKVNEKDRRNSITSSYYAAKKCMEVNQDVVNKVILERYKLPPLSIGIGLAMSKAVITLVGLKNFSQPKVLGECVYRASKLSSGQNKIYVDTFLHESWPTSKGGKLKFQRVKRSDVDGYMITY
ncbi:hypothetical protein JCM31598_24010 [Desulfonatronum parangueonense]